MSWCLMGKVKLLTNLAPRIPLPLSTSPPMLLCKKIPLCHCTHVWRSLYSAERPHKFCVAINYRHHGWHIWAYYHKASWEDISCGHYSVGSDRERFKMPNRLFFHSFVGPGVTPETSRQGLLVIFNNISGFTDTARREKEGCEERGREDKCPFLISILSLRGSRQHLLLSFDIYSMYSVFLKILVNKDVLKRITD